MYYAQDKFKIKGFEKSDRKNKMYNAILLNKDTMKLIKVPFGDSNMGNYQDRTGLNLYPKLIHGDKKRRKAFQDRFHHLLREGFYSPSYFSYYYLW